MFDRDSRYAGKPIKTLTDENGREISYVSRRLIPQEGRVLAEVRVQDGDRLDLIAERAYGDPRASWRIKDANPKADPDTLDDTPRARLKLTQVEAE